jgi:phospho-N-acetylmuramoyl-pentapeptide-transferase
VREIATVTLAPAIFVLFCIVIVSAWSNAVNFTDGLDGLAAGAMAMVCAAYVLITFWQFRNACATSPGLGCYNVRDPLDLAIIAAATAGACIGFLWWNAAPAKIFMGDTGSLALGGIIAGLSVASRTEMLAVVLGALFVAEVTSVVVQIMAFRTTGRRVFRMAPFHHHFELVGWAETTVIIRFWLLTAIACGLGVALFYSEWLTTVGA